MAQVNTGTVTTDGTAVIVGSGTDWLTSVQPLLGGSNAPSFSISALVGGDGAAYDVISVASDTSLTLSSAYAGANVSGKAYGITIDFTTNFGIPEVGVGDKNAPGIVTRALRKIDTVINDFKTGVRALTNVDIDGGTIDGTTIGASSHTTAKVTTIEATTGIYLGGSAAANLIDDYEEGTWFPQLTSGFTTTPTAAAAQPYWIINDLVTIRCSLSSFGSITTNGTPMIVGGLPITPALSTDTGLGNSANQNFSTGTVVYWRAKTDGTIALLEQSPNSSSSEVAVNTSASTTTTASYGIFIIQYKR
jgi:hypothetical protein